MRSAKRCFSRSKMTGLPGTLFAVCCYPGAVTLDPLPSIVQHVCTGALTYLSSSTSQAQTGGGRRTGRPRSNTAHSYHERYEPLHEDSVVRHSESRPTLRSRQPSSNYAESPSWEAYPSEPNLNLQRPAFNRTPPAFEGPTNLRQEQPPTAHLHRAASDFEARRSQSHARSYNQHGSYDDNSDEHGPFGRPSPDASFGDGSASPSTSHSRILSRTTSASTLSSSVGLSKKAPPPPPPRSKKPPPPPPVKRPSLGV